MQRTEPDRLPDVFNSGSVDYVRHILLVSLTPLAHLILPLHPLLIPSSKEFHEWDLIFVYGDSASAPSVAR